MDKNRKVSVSYLQEKEVLLFTQFDISGIIIMRDLLFYFPVSQPSAQDKSNIVHVNHQHISKHQQTANKENKIPISVIVVQVGCR